MTPDELSLALLIYVRSLGDRFPDPSKVGAKDGAKFLARRSLFLARAFYEAISEKEDPEKRRVTLSVSDVKREGLDARWGKSSGGGKCLQVRDPSSEDVRLRASWHDVTVKLKRLATELGSWKKALHSISS